MGASESREPAARAAGSHFAAKSANNGAGRVGLQISGGDRNADATAPAAHDVTTADAVEGGLAGLRGVARTRFRV
jgi:hypothetical protein